MNCKELIQNITSGNYDQELKTLYADESMLEMQKNRYISALESFYVNFGDADGVHIFSAPGRTEICGNHTDHQHGMCVAGAINLDVIAVARGRPKSDSTVNVFSEGYSLITFDCNDMKYSLQDQGTTTALVKGALQGLKNSGFQVGGFDCYITSNVIVGAGLSSSAAIENAIGSVVNHLFNEGKIIPAEIAKASKYSENVYFGKPCGLLDQMASSVGGLVYLDFMDSNNPEYKKIDIDFAKNGYSLCIVDVKASHADLTADYAAIPQEMRSVAVYFGKDFLREVNPSDFYSNIANLRSRCSDRAILRAYHFFEEEKRVENLVKALEQNDFQGFLDNVKLSGQSSFMYLQNIYSPSDPKNQGVAIGLAFTQKFLESSNSGESKGVFRVHGGGFAGTIQVFVKDAYVKEYKEKIEQIFGLNSCHIMKIRPAGSVKVF